MPNGRHDLKDVFFELRFSKFPTELPNLGVYVVIEGEVHKFKELSGFKLEILTPDAKPFVSIENAKATYPKSDLLETGHFALALNIAKLKIKEPGEYICNVTINGLPQATRSLKFTKI